MLFQGEEYGERAPFQFFSDHIDEEIADATREGRRREFAAFAEFRGEEVPDPQDPATFERSKLTRERRAGGLRELYAELLRAAPRAAARRRRATIDVRRARRLAARRPRPVRAGRELLARATRTCPLDGAGEIVVATATVTLEPGYVVLPPLSGALVRLT